MRNQKYVKVAYQSKSTKLLKAVDVIQNLPGHCVATTRQSQHGVDIENVRNRCIARWQEIKRMKDAQTPSVYRNKVRKDWGPDIEAALRIAESVYLWLSNWDAKVTSGSMDKVYQDPVFVSYHEVTRDESMSPDYEVDTGGRDSGETGFGADTSYNEEWN